MQCICRLTAAVMFTALFAAAAAAESANIPSAGETVRVAGLDWYTDYVAAYAEAKRAQKMLVINFVSDDQAQRGLEQAIADGASLQFALAEVVLLRISPEAMVGPEGEQIHLLGHDAFRDMGGAAGIAMIDLRDSEAAYYGDVVTALPFAKLKYYRWEPSHLRVALDLPPGTIYQRTMVWAVRVHPESPASTRGEQHPLLMELATAHSEEQARTGIQGHQGFGRRFNKMRDALGSVSGKEVVAESWSNQGLIDSCLDCVRSWRHSPGHWDAVSHAHTYYGYDIRLGENGIWYGTGLFADRK